MKPAKASKRSIGSGTKVQIPGAHTRGLEAPNSGLVTALRWDKNAPTLELKATDTWHQTRDECLEIRERNKKCKYNALSFFKYNLLGQEQDYARAREPRLNWACMNKRPELWWPYIPLSRKQHHTPSVKQSYHTEKLKKLQAWRAQASFKCCQEPKRGFRLEKSS